MDDALESLSASAQKAVKERDATLQFLKYFRHDPVSGTSSQKPLIYK
jgi:hypothetical protein